MQCSATSLGTNNQIQRIRSRIPWSPVTTIMHPRLIYKAASPCRLPQLIFHPHLRLTDNSLKCPLLLLPSSDPMITHHTKARSSPVIWLISRARNCPVWQKPVHSMKSHTQPEWSVYSCLSVSDTYGVCRLSRLLKVAPSSL